MPCATEPSRCCTLQASQTTTRLSTKCPERLSFPSAPSGLWEHNPCDAVIAIGTVIRGETAHFDYVCKAASEGILRVGLDTGNPTIFCVLTDDTIEQSRARSGGEHGNKGVEAAVACLQMLDLKSNLYGG